MSDEDSGVLRTESYSLQSAEDGKTCTYETGEGIRTDRTTTHNLGVGDRVELGGQSYRIERIISGENATAEAVIYLVRAANDEVYCLKLYYPFRNPQDEPNPEALKRIQAIKNPDILRLHSAGTGPDKFRSQFCYEVCDYARGGDLLSVEEVAKHYTPDFLAQKIIPQIFKGIKTLHKNHIYHCDLKPQNVFYLDEEKTNLVIGDYGSAKTFEQSTEKDLAYVSMVKGTEWYLAPEQAIGIISEKNDYYSFGMIVLHLLYPHLMDRQTLRKIYERRAAQKPIVDYDPRHKRLNDLIAGLTLQDIQRRWGEQEVARWLKGETVSVQYRAEPVSETVPIKIGPVTVQTEKDLIEYVQQGGEWFQYLLQDEQGYGQLLDWLSRYQNIQSKRRFDRLMRIAAPKGVEFAREALVRYFQPQRAVRVLSDFEVFTAGDVRSLAGRLVSELEDHWKVTSLEEMSLYLFCFGMALEQRLAASDDEKGGECKELLTKLKEAFRPPTAEEAMELSNGESKGRKKKSRSKMKGRIEYAAEKLDAGSTEDWSILSIEVTDRGILRLFYDFNPDREFRDLTGKGYATLEQVGLFLAANPEHWNDRFLREERRAFLRKSGHSEWLALGREALLLQVFKEEAMLEAEVSAVRPAEASPAMGVEVKYKIHRTLAPFFERQGITQDVRELAESGSATIRKFVQTDDEELIARFLSSLDHFRKLPRDRWTSDSLDRAQTTLVAQKGKLKKETRALRRQQIRADAEYAFKSFLILLPPLLLFFLAMAFLEKDHRLVNLIAGCSPFEIAFDQPFANDAEDSLLPRWQTGLGVWFLVTVVLLPSCWLWDRQRWLGIGSLLFSYLVFGWAVILSPLPVAALYLIVVPILMYGLETNRLRPVPFLVSLVPIVLIAWWGYVLFRPVPPSTLVAEPLNFRASTPSKRVPVRVGTSPEHAVIGVVGYTDTVKVVQERSGWYLVQLHNLEGYVPGETFVRVTILNGKVKKRNPYLMSAPTYDTTTVRTVVRGSPLSILAIEGDWYLVRLDDKTQGYLHHKDVEIIER